MDLPVNYDKEEFARIKAAAARIKQDTDIFIAIGIGRARYLGARAAIEFLKSPLYNVKKKDTPDVYFAGNSISSTALAELLELCEGRRVSINVISKSGHHHRTGDCVPGAAGLSGKDGGEGRSQEAHLCGPPTVPAARLRGLADREGYETFVVPDDVGGALFGADGGGTAADCGGRLRYRRPDGRRGEGARGTARSRPA